MTYVGTACAALKAENPPRPEPPDLSVFTPTHTHTHTKRRSALPSVSVSQSTDALVDCCRGRRVTAGPPRPFLSSALAVPLPSPSDEHEHDHGRRAPGVSSVRAKGRSG